MLVINKDTLMLCPGLDMVNTGHEINTTIDHVENASQLVSTTNISKNSEILIGYSGHTNLHRIVYYGFFMEKPYFNNYDEWVFNESEDYKTLEKIVISIECKEAHKQELEKETTKK